MSADDGPGYKAPPRTAAGLRKGQLRLVSPTLGQASGGVLSETGMSRQLSPHTNPTFEDDSGDSRASDRGPESGKDTPHTVSDPWKAPDLENNSLKWSELTRRQKSRRVFILCGKLLLLMVSFYLFICSLDFLGSAFRLIGGKKAGETMRTSVLLSNPIAGLMVGVLVTVLVQSSSTSTSIVVSMVASSIISVRMSISVIMGANIGTSVTNTIVAMTQASDRGEFRRAFAAATVHDMFNWLTVFVLLPLESVSGYLYHLSKAIVSVIEQRDDAKDIELLTTITTPFTNLVIQLDKELIEKIARGEDVHQSLVRTWCVTETKNETVTLAKNALFSGAVSCTEVRVNGTVQTCRQSPAGVNVTWNEHVTRQVTVNQEKCAHIFAGTAISDSAVGVILLVSSIFILCTCLVCIVKVLHSMLQGKTAAAIKRVVNSNLPKPFGFLTGYLAILIGAGLTTLLQSSSIFTSTLTPLVGLGVITLERMYPMTIGSNLGTTFTSIMASMTATGNRFAPALQIAFCHLFFNLSGILIWYPVPQMRRVPVFLAEKLGDVTSRYRWFAIVYVLGMFLVFPGLVFGISALGWPGWVGLTVPVLLLLTFVLVVDVLQTVRPKILPGRLKTWDFVPRWLRSLEPYDKPMTDLGNYLGRLRRNCRLPVAPPCHRPPATTSSAASLGEVIPLGDGLPVTKLKPFV